MKERIITLDGPAGSGKSTYACELAKRLGAEYLDTGAMYRAIAVACLDQAIDPAAQPERVGDIARRVRMWFDFAKDPPPLFLDDTNQTRDVTDRVRDEDVTTIVSEVASISAVRAVLVDAQRQIAREHPFLVTEGRDQGSIVFPDALAKFYVDADADVRAQRRAAQNKRGGRSADEKVILSDLDRRDHQDSTRREAPLHCPADAIPIDTSQMDVSQVVDELSRHIEENLRLAGSP